MAVLLAAEQDLSDIWLKGAATWGVEHAEHYADGLFALFDLLVEFPKIAREEYGIEGVEYVNQFFKDKAHDSQYLKDLKKRAADHGAPCHAGAGWRAVKLRGAGRHAADYPAHVSRHHHGVSRPRAAFRRIGLAARRTAAESRAIAPQRRTPCC